MTKSYKGQPERYEHI